MFTLILAIACIVLMLAVNVRDKMADLEEAGIAEPFWSRALWGHFLKELLAVCLFLILESVLVHKLFAAGAPIYGDAAAVLALYASFSTFTFVARHMPPVHTRRAGLAVGVALFLASVVAFYGMSLRLTSEVALSPLLRLCECGLLFVAFWITYVIADYAVSAFFGWSMRLARWCARRDALASYGDFRVALARYERSHIGEAILIKRMLPIADRAIAEGNWPLVQQVAAEGQKACSRSAR